MTRHYFHCTDGMDLILDRTGRLTRNSRDVERYAHETAQAVMQNLPSYAEWARWLVCIYDDQGQVDVTPFPAPRRQVA